MTGAPGVPWAVRVHVGLWKGACDRGRIPSLAAEGGDAGQASGPTYQRRWMQIQRLKRRGQRRSGTPTQPTGLAGLPTPFPPPPRGSGGKQVIAVPPQRGRTDSETRAKGVRLYFRRDSAAFLEARGVSPADVSAAAARCPRLLFSPVHDGLESAWDAIDASGASPVKVVSICPAALTLPPPVLRRRLETLRAALDDLSLFGTLVEEAPELLLREALDGKQASRRLDDLARVLGSSKALATALRQSPGRFLSLDFDAGEALTDLVEVFDGSVETATRALSRDSRLLGTRKGGIAEAAAFLGERGVDVGALIARQPTLASVSATRIAAKVYWLEAVAGQEAATAAVRRTPSILLASLEGQLKPVVAFLTEIGVDPAAVAKKAPSVLTRSVSGHLVPLCAYLDDLMDLAGSGHEVARKYPILLAYGVESKLQRNASFLADRGLDVPRVVRAHPPVLAYSTERNMAPKLDYLVDVMGRDVSQVNALPQFLGYSLHARIIPRHTFIRKLGTAECSLSAMLTRSDADFACKVLKVSPEEFAAHVRAHKNALTCGSRAVAEPPSS